MQSDMRSDSSSTFIIKYCGAFIFLAAGVGIFGEDFVTWRFLFILVFLFPGVFLASLATVEMEGGRIRYRRLFSWAELKETEILRAGTVFPPFFGFLKLKKNIWPWGRLYFVLDKNSQPNPFRRGTFRLIDFFNKQDRSNADLTTPIADQNVHTKLAIATSLGILASLLFFYLTPSEAYHAGLTTSTPNLTPWMKISFQLVGVLNLASVQIAGLALLGFLALRTRRSSEAWIYAFLFGFTLTIIGGRLFNVF